MVLIMLVVEALVAVTLAVQRARQEQVVTVEGGMAAPILLEAPSERLQGLLIPVVEVVAAVTRAM